MSFLVVSGLARLSLSAGGVSDPPWQHQEAEVHPGCRRCPRNKCGMIPRPLRVVCSPALPPCHTRLPGTFYQVLLLTSECSKLSFLLGLAVLSKTSEKTATRRPGRPTYGQEHYGTESIFRGVSLFLLNLRKPDQ